jgi:hypothetical protein
MSDESDRSVSRRSALKTVGAAALGTLGVGAGASTSVSAASPPDNPPEKTTLDLGIWSSEGTIDEWASARQVSEQKVKNEISLIALFVEKQFKPLVKHIDGLTSVNVKSPDEFLENQWNSFDYSKNSANDVLQWEYDVINDQLENGSVTPAIDGNLFLLNDVNFDTGVDGSTAPTVHTCTPYQSFDGQNVDLTRGYVELNVWQAMPPLLNTNYDWGTNVPNDTPFDTDFDGVYEDVDGDDDITVVDSQRVLDKVNQGGPDEVVNATYDIDSDGDLDVDDSEYLLENPDNEDTAIWGDVPLYANGIAAYVLAGVIHELSHSLGIQHDQLDAWEVTSAGDTATTFMGAGYYPDRLSGVDLNGNMTNDFGENIPLPADGEERYYAMAFNDDFVENFPEGRDYWGVFGVTREPPSYYSDP